MSWINIHVVVPSYRRSDIFLTDKALANFKLVVRPEEVGVYRERLPDVEIVELDKGVAGLPNTRQWILDHFRNVCMVDDDIEKVQRLYPAENRGSSLTPQEAYDIIQLAGNMAREAGIYLFGFNNNPSGLLYDPFEPISLSGFINTAALGVLEGSKLFFDPRFVATEDYWLSGLNAHYHRMIWKDNRFNFKQVGNFVRKGGASMYRTVETEREDVLNLRRMFGNAVKLNRPSSVGRKGYIRPTTSIKYSRHLEIPF